MDFFFSSNLDRSDWTVWPWSRYGPALGPTFFICNMKRLYLFYSPFLPRWSVVLILSWFKSNYSCRGDFAEYHTQTAECWSLSGRVLSTIKECNPIRSILGGQLAPELKMFWLQSDSHTSNKEGTLTWEGAYSTNLAACRANKEVVFDFIWQASVTQDAKWGFQMKTVSFIYVNLQVSISAKKITE